MGNNKSTVSVLYIILVSIGSFILAVLFFLASNLLAEKLQSLIFSVVFLILVVMVGILADILGVSVTAADQAPLHSKAAKKIPGSVEGVFLIRNADRVANLMNDVVGDIAGTVSGALGIALVAQILTHWQDISQLVMNMLLTAMIAALTVGGKAAGKRIALVHAEEVVFAAGKVLHWVSLVTGKKFTAKPRKNTK